VTRGGPQAKEVLAVQPLESPSLNAMTVEIREIDRHLEAISRATDTAAHAIIDCAERLAQCSKWASQDEREIFNREIANLLQSCAFGDLFGQRLARSQAALWRLADHVEVARGIQSRIEERSASATCLSRTRLDGPQSPGEGLEQDEIDRFFK
jgi:hypothetical protein